MTAVDPAVQLVISMTAQRLLTVIDDAGAAEFEVLVDEGHCSALVATGQISAAMTYLVGTIVENVRADLRAPMLADAVRQMTMAIENSLVDDDAAEAGVAAMNVPGMTMQ